MVNRFAFLVDVPDEEDRQEYATAEEDLTPEDAVVRCYDVMPNGSEIIKPLRGDIPQGLDLSPPDQDPEPAITAVTESEDSDTEEVAAGDEETDMGALHLTDEHWKTAVSAIEDGDADEFLDDLAAVDDRDSVNTAINERRESL